MNWRIGDKHVRDAVETIVAELENAEAMVATMQNDIQSLESIIETKNAEIDKLMNDVEELHSEVKRLDDALADTYISQVDPKAARNDQS